MAELNFTRNSVLDEAIGACLAAVPTAAAQMRMGTAAASHAACADAVRALKKTTPFDNSAARDVLAERRRQVEAEGYDPEHDDAHPNEEIAAYAALYAMPPAARGWPATKTGYGDTVGAALCPVGWHPKFGDRRRELVKAAALLLAEIERIDRDADQPTALSARVIPAGGANRNLASVRRGLQQALTAARGDQ